MYGQKLEQEHNKIDADNAAFESIVVRASRGDDRALYILCEKIASRVLFHATQILRNQKDAEDVSQEALIRVCEKIGDLRDPKAFKGWLGRIVTNEAAGHLRKTAKQGVVLNIDDYLENVMEYKDDFLPEEYAKREETRQYVMEIINGLPMRQREAVLLHYYYSMSVNEVADAMGIDQSSVSKHLGLARQKLKNEIKARPIDKKSVNAGIMAMLPMSDLMTGIFEFESESFVAANKAWAQRALKRCGEYIQSNSASVSTAAVATKSLFWPLTGLLAVVLAAGVAVFGVQTAKSSIPKPAGVYTQAPALPLELRVVFTGGVFSDDSAHINPTDAELLVQSGSGDEKILGWSITPMDGEAVLYSGEDGDITQALGDLRATGGGLYMLRFRVEGKSGVYYAEKNFRIT